MSPAVAGLSALAGTFSPTRRRPRRGRDQAVHRGAGDRHRTARPAWRSRSAGGQPRERGQAGPRQRPPRTMNHRVQWPSDGGTVQFKCRRHLPFPSWPTHCWQRRSRARGRSGAVLRRGQVPSRARDAPDAGGSHVCATEVADAQEGRGAPQFGGVVTLIKRRALQRRDLSACPDGSPVPGQTPRGRSGSPQEQLHRHGDLAYCHIMGRGWHRRELALGDCLGQRPSGR